MTREGIGGCLGGEERNDDEEEGEERRRVEMLRQVFSSVRKCSFSGRVKLN